MNMHGCRGLIVVALWQLAPVYASTDHHRDTRIRVGFGRGLYEALYASCGGPDTYDAVDFAGGGAHVEAWPAENVRVDGSLGLTSHDTVPETELMAGGLVAFDGRRVGIGAGFLAVTGVDPVVVPGLYLRAGSRDGLQVRLDALTPQPMRYGADVRLGAAYGQAGNGVSVFAGIAECVHCNANGLPLFLELQVPLAGRAAIDARAFRADGEVHTNWGVYLGTRFHLPRSR